MMINIFKQKAKGQGKNRKQTKYILYIIYIFSSIEFSQLLTMVVNLTNQAM